MTRNNDELRLSTIRDAFLAEGCCQREALSETMTLRQVQELFADRKAKAMNRLKEIGLGEDDVGNREIVIEITCYVEWSYGQVYAVCEVRIRFRT